MVETGTAGPKSHRNGVRTRFLSLIGLLLIWEIAARLIGSRVFPPASTVILTMWQETFHGVLVMSLLITMARVAASFVVAMFFGVALGLAMGLWRRVDLVLDSWLTMLLNVPALVLIVLIYIWFGLTEAALVVGVALNKLPTTAVILREGARSIDRNLMDMAVSFRLSRWASFRHVLAPQLYPYLFASGRSGLSLIWKIVLVAEILGRSSGVGFQIEIYFQLFDVTRILAYSLMFILVMQLIEWGALQPLERYATKGRK